MSSIKFEVFGKVQGVWFRKYTKKKADELGIFGWCKNTSKGTVKGEATGETDKMKEFRTYLINEGSPKSRINHAKIEVTEKLDFSDFQIIR